MRYVKLEFSSYHARQYFVNEDDTVPQKVKESLINILHWDIVTLNFQGVISAVIIILKKYLLLLQVVVQKNSRRGVHFRRAGPR